MIVEPIEFALVSEGYSEATEPRSPGLHLSTIIRDLRRVEYPETDEATRQAYFSVGFMWEQILTAVFRDTALRTREGVLFRPGEVMRDGIAMSPDAVDATDYALEEYKATWLSSIHPIDDKRFWPWLIQMKCYCRAIGTYTARLRVFFVNGDWRGSGPQARAWQFTFTERDLDEAWSMCVNHAKAKGWL